MDPMHAQAQPITSHHVLALPYPGRGHITPMLSLCSAVAGNRPDFLITVILTEEWLGFLGSIPKPPNVRFVAIPNVVPSELVRGRNPRGFWRAVNSEMEDPVQQLLERRLRPRPDIIIADAFVTWAVGFAGRKNIPVASLWPMSASVFTACYHFDLIVKNGDFPIELSVNGDKIVDYIPGLSPHHLRDLPKVMRKQEDALDMFQLIPNSKFLIFNSIHALESQPIHSLKHTTPYSIYNIAPPPPNNNYGHQESLDQYLHWLDLQPNSSVLYISLGSFLSVSAAQTDEIVNGLVQSGVRFLWATRDGISQLQNGSGKGLVVAWCDQLRVLRHPGVGGFLTHCGWNSTKEAVHAGVPMLTFPILMDQLPNAKAIVEDWKVGWRVKREFDAQDLAKGDEIAALVKRFMDSECVERQELSRNARRLKEICEGENETGELANNPEGFLTSILENC